jgi:uncharacterized damage-inducible protein DinB
MAQLEVKPQTEKVTFLTSDVFLNHWLGHKKLTRRVIEVFPEDKLFSYSVGGMRPFAELVMEMLHMGAPGMKGIITNEWPSYQDVEQALKTPTTKDELLRLWDESMEEIKVLWPQIPAYRFQETVKIFGQWEGPVYWSVLYFIDNEIHHRGQGYVYLRSLGIEPPPFWDR